MKVQHWSNPVYLGHSFNVPITRYELDNHALIHSVGNTKDKRGRWGRGGGFYVAHRTIKLTPIALPDYILFGNLHGGLSVSASAPGASIGPQSYESWSSVASNLAPWGATGYARARPMNPAANLAQSVIELRDAPKMVPSFMKGPLKGMARRALQQLASFRQLGSSYLNYEFGWKPYVNDLREMYKLSYEIDNKLDQLRRHNGRNMHRERVLKDVTTTTGSSVSNGGAFAYLYPTPILGLSHGTSTKTSITTYSEKVWFEGLFRYWVPNIGSPQWTRNARNALFGANLTPKVAWDVLPWSWLIDWFSNAGDVMQNLSTYSDDSVVARYAYVMRHVKEETTETITTTWTGRSTSPTYDGGAGTAVQTTRYESKARTVGNPYGWGITYDGLSGRQQGILAALAISRKSFL